MTPHPRTLIAIISALGLTLTLSACGSQAWTTESVEAALLSSDDFSFDVSRTDDDPAFDKDDGSTLFNTGEDCASNTAILMLLEKGESLGSAGYEERSDDQNSFSVEQQVIQLESPEAVAEVIAEAERGYKDDDCGYSNITSLSGVTAYASTDYSNARTLSDAFGIEATPSLVWDMKYSSLFTGNVVFDLSSVDEGGVVLAGSGNAILIVTYETDTYEDADEEISRRDLEDAIEKSLTRFFS